MLKPLIYTSLQESLHSRYISYIFGQLKEMFVPPADISLLRGEN